MKTVRRPPASGLLIGVLAPAAVVGCNLIVGIHGVTGPDTGGTGGGGGAPSSSSSGGPSPPTCASSQKLCGDVCVSTMDPANGCADPKSCDPCKFANGVAGCADGACALLDCVNGYSECNGDAGDGCEVHTANDVANCGSCNHSCSAQGGTPSCAGGACSSVVCTGDNADCDENPGNGCEVDLDTDGANCGVCHHVCGSAHASNSSCSSGTCVFTCMAPYTRCTSSTDADGCNIDTSIDSNNCGSCGHVCGSSNGTGICSGSTCGFTCTAPYQHCSKASSDDSLGCNVDLNTDARNCGSCGHSCGSGACSGGVCQPWTVTTTVSTPLNLVINGSYIVWTENTTGGVYSVPISTVNGAHAGTQLSNLTANGDSWDVVLNNNYSPARAYWTDRANGAVYYNSVAGPATAATKYFNDPYGAGTYGITLIGNTVWVNNIDRGGVSYSTAGTTATMFDVPPQGPQGCSYYGGAITSYSSLPLESNFGSGRLMYNGTAIGAGTNYGSRYLATDSNYGGTYAYWTTLGDCGATTDQAVWAMPIPGSTSATTPRLIASSEGNPNGIVADAKWSVYWANNAGIRHSTSTDGTTWTTPTTIATGNPHDVDVNVTTIFWTDSNAIRAVAK